MQNFCTKLYKRRDFRIYMIKRRIIDIVFQDSIFREEPPVLVDLGAAGSIHEEWQSIAKHSICIAFDADEREFGYITDIARKYKKLCVIRKIACASGEGYVNFYLTTSAYCSSTLMPIKEELQKYSFHDLFRVKFTKKMLAVNLSKVIEEQELNYIDWFKADTQGIDLQLFQCLGRELIDSIIVADFEPGIISAYKGEDKLYSLMQYMDELPFWVSDMRIKGAERISKKVLEDTKISSYIRYGNGILKTSPGWAEISYFRDFSIANKKKKRQMLLGIVFAAIKDQWGYAFELTRKAETVFCEKIFQDLKQIIIRKIKKRYSVAQVKKLLRPISIVKIIVKKIRKQ